MKIYRDERTIGIVHKTDNVLSLEINNCQKFIDVLLL